MDSPNDGYCSATYKSGEKKGKRCTNVASLKYKKEYFCKVHCKAEGAKTIPIKKSEDFQEDRNERIENARLRNVEKERPGRIMCSKLYMMKVPHEDGYLSVFPNYKHEGRKDGLGIKSLSPMSLGPVIHGQEDLPDACNLENFWQGSKRYFDQSTKEFNKQRKAMFSDETPHRHNEGRKGVKPKGWYYKGVLYDYISARYFYCSFYEDLVKEHASKDLKKLKRLLRKGTNLNIIGYDGIYCKSPSRKDLIKMYNDESKPFGHELCLVSLLVCEDDNYPWSK